MMQRATMNQSTALGLAGAMLLIAGAMMAVNAVEAFLGGVPRSLWILYIYEPIAVVMFVVGAYWLVRAQTIYNAGRRLPPPAGPAL
jgi:hypothetical protein